MLAEYRWPTELTAQYIQVLEKIYKEEWLANPSWASVTLSISNQQYSIIPKALFQADKLPEYLNFACPQNLSTIKYFTHSVPSIVLTFGLDPLAIQWFKKVYSESPLYYIHQASSLIEGSMHYIQDQVPLLSRCTFVFIESYHFHIIIVEQQQLLYYNRFAYETNEDLLHYLLVAMQTLDLEPASEEVILAGDVDRRAEIYKEIARYHKKVQLYTGPIHLTPTKLLNQETRLKYFDLLSTALLH